MSAEPQLVWRADEIAAGAFPFRHPLDGSARCTISGISRMAGLASTGLNLVTIAPGETAFPLHRHHGQEEWVYVLSGEAEVRLDDSRHALGAGDFAHFPAAGPAHSVTNAGTADLVCLMGGVTVASEVIDFPDLDRRVTWTKDGLEVAPLSAFSRFEAPGEETE